MRPGCSTISTAKRGLGASSQLSLGHCDKIVDETFYGLSKTFGGGVTMHWKAWRTSVCERVKVGTKVVPAEPAREAQPERVEDVFEYQCPSLFAALRKPERRDHRPPTRTPRTTRRRIPRCRTPSKVSQFRF